jgi:hypothetical protein
MNAYYVLAKANSDTDGSGSFPANPYDLSTEYGRATGDIRHRFVMTGNFRAPWGISLNPFVIVQSGRPFNITLGRDLNNDTLNTSDRLSRRRARIVLTRSISSALRTATSNSRLRQAM